MKLFHSLLREAAFIRHDRSVIVAVILVFSLSCVSVVGGLFEVERQNKTIEQLIKADNQDRSSELSKQKNWGGAAYYSFHLTYDPPTPFTFAAMGQRDSKPWKHRIRMLALEGQIYERDASNPVIALIGRFDFSFFSAFVLPFIMIVLLHDLRSSERREGRYHLVIASAGTGARLWFSRTAVISLSIYAAAIIPLILSCVVSGVSISVTGTACLFLGLYVLFWSIIGFWFASWKKSSSVILTSLIGFWSLLAVIIPTGGRIVIDNLITVPSGSEILMLQRETVNDAWDKSKEETMDAFIEHYPEWSAHAKIERPFEWKWYYAFQQVGDQKTAHLSLAYREGRLFRDRLASYLALLAPPALLERSFQNLAETSTKALFSYEEEVRDFHQRLRYFYYPKLFQDQPFENKLLNDLPRFSSSAAD